MIIIFYAIITLLMLSSLVYAPILSDRPLTSRDWVWLTLVAGLWPISLIAYAYVTATKED